MINEGLISIIVPVYNVVDYVDKCISSIVAQTYKNIEIIIVDDGSTDGSGEICDKWAKNDIRIQVCHKKNGGLSSARNVGISRSNGDFIGFVDSDDYISDDMYESMLKHMEDDVDITACGRVYVYPNKSKMRNFKARIASDVLKMSNEVAMDELLKMRYLDFSVCTKLFRRNLWENVKFLNGRTSEDLPVSYELVKKSRKVVNIAEAKYYYMYREDSISHKSFELRRIDYVLFYRDIYKDVKRSYPQEVNLAEALYIGSIISTWELIQNNQSSKEKYKIVQNRLRKGLKRMLFRILFNKNITDEMKDKAIKIIMLNRNDT